MTRTLSGIVIGLREAGLQYLYDFPGPDFLGLSQKDRERLVGTVFQ